MNVNCCRNSFISLVSEFLKDLCTADLLYAQAYVVKLRNNHIFKDSLLPQSRTLLNMALEAVKRVSKRRPPVY